MKTLNVLHVSTTIQRGGAENHVYDLVQHQRRSGMDVRVAYLRGASRDLGVPTHDLALRYYGELEPLRHLRNLILATSPDIVHAHMPPAELYSRLALTGIPSTSLPLLITKHNEEPFYRGPGQKLMGRWVARRASAVIAISHAVHRYMSGPALGIHPEKLHTIHYGIDARPFRDAPPTTGRALRHQWGVPDNAMLVGFVGRLVPQKAIDTLLRAFAVALRQATSPIWLAIVGNGPLEGVLRQQASEFGIANRVIWAGFHEDMPPVMRAFDVFTLTSIYEGFGLVLVEAMAAGLPVVATRAGAIPEIIVPGETGILVQPGAVDTLATAWQQLRDVSLRLRLGSAGQRRVFEEFTLEKMFDETDRLYARLVSDKRGALCLAC